MYMCRAPSVETLFYVILRIEQSINIQGKYNEKRGGRGWQLMHRKNMIQDQIAKVVACAVGGKGKWKLYRHVVS